MLIQKLTQQAPLGCALSGQFVAASAWNRLALVPLSRTVRMMHVLPVVQDTYVFVDATIDPEPSVRSRVLRIGHVRSRIEAPSGAIFVSYLVPAAKQGPDVLRSRRVSRVVLLLMRFNIKVLKASNQNNRETSR